MIDAGRPTLPRRDWLRTIGVGGVFAWTGLHAGRERTATGAERESDASRLPGFGRAKSVLVVFCNGGQSHLDIWDPKPEAPAEVRGEFRTIRTSVPGTLLGEHLPLTARLADRFTLVRSMSHLDLDHGSSVYLALTGHYHAKRSSNPPPRPEDEAVPGAILKRLRPARGTVDAAIHVNAPVVVAPQDIAPGQFAGVLGREFDPLVVGDPSAGPLVVPGLTPLAGLPLQRVHERRRLVERLDALRREADEAPAARDLDGSYRRAYELLETSAAREAFDLSREPEKVRERYGRDRSAQSCLLGRRLIEAGVPLVTVVWNHHSRGQDKDPDTTESYGWDTHNDIFEALSQRLLPRFDRSFSALLEDLDERGLLDETLVLCFGEFGRAPLVALEPRFAGASPGRKHWSSAYSIVAAGAGVARGKIVGRTDRLGAYPVTESYGPWDVTATLFAALGLDPAAHYLDPTARRRPITTGRPIAALYGG